MANFITTSISQYAKEGFDFFLKPLFIGTSPFATPGIAYEGEVRGKKKLNLWGNSAAAKIVKKYVKGFNGSSIATFTQRTIETHQLKAEAAQDANEFFDTVYAYAQNSGIDWNNVSGTVFEQILVQIWQQAVASDIFRQYWLADTNKEKITSGVFNGTADDDYNMFDGMWKLLIDNATTTPSSDDDIKRVAFSNGAVAQVSTVTLTTGSSGDLTLSLMGVDYTVAYGTSYTVTAALFVTTHAADIAKRGVTVTSSTADIVFTSSIAGQPFGAPTFHGDSDITGTVAATTANTAPADLSADEALGALKSLRKTADPILREIPAADKVYLVSDSVYYNYLESIEGFNSTYTWTTEDGRNLMINGANVLNFSGSMVIKMGWDFHLDNDFPTAYPHRIIYTEKNNLRVGFDTTNDTNAVEMWYDQNNQENRFRVQFFMGCQYVHGRLTAVAY